MRILVVGAGATGGFFGGRLHQAGRDVTFLVRPGRAAALRERGLTILSPAGEITLRPPLLTAPEVAGPFDLVILTVKSYALESALADAAAAIGPQTAVLPLLNGMAHLDRLTELLGAERVLGGVCRIASTLDADGRVHQLAAFADLSYGELSGARSERIERVHEALTGAGFDALVSDDIRQAMWDKWIMLAALGATTCLLRGTIGAVTAAPGGAEIAAAILDECVAVAAGSGHPPDETYHRKTRAMLTAAGSAQTSSMYRDLQNGAPVEADHILGDMLVRARALGREAPLVGAAYAALKVYEGGREAT